MSNRIVGICIGLCAGAAVFAVMINMTVPEGQKPGKKYPVGIVSALPATGDWIRPEGNADELYDSLSVEDLIDRWNRWPQKPRMEGVHMVYAKALALYEEEALPALPHLAKAVTHFEPNLRKSVMEALVAIGEEGIPPLIKAMELWPPEDPNKRALEIHWDASEYLVRAAQKEIDISEALPVLQKCLMNPKDSVFARQNAAFALSIMGTPEAREVLEEGREWFYEQDGLSVSETRILKNINIGLRKFGQPPPEEPEEPPLH